VVVTGGGLSAAAATQASAPIQGRAARCYQDRWAQDPSVAGSLFVSAVVRPDGFVATTSVFGPLQDRTLSTCLEGAIADWSFPAFPGEATSEVVLPFTFREEAPPKGRRAR
jgi:F0F1-type ATP synthase membrane subunit c/vacuolar-type H+-ATPase subunit K